MLKPQNPINFFSHLIGPCYLSTSRRLQKRKRAESVKTWNNTHELGRPVTKPVGEGGGCLVEELCQRCNRVRAICCATLHCFHRDAKSKVISSKNKIMVNLRKGIGHVFGILQTLSSEMRSLTILGAFLSPLHDFFERVHFG